MASRVFGSTAVLVAALALTVAYAWPEQPAGWNASAHFALVRSLADGTATIDPYRDETGDVGWYRGHYYAAKAPGLALYSLPPWLVLERIPQIGDARDRAIWALNFWAGVVPAILLFLLVRAVGDRLAPGTGPDVGDHARPRDDGPPFATMYFSHIPAAAASFAAFALLVRERDGPFRPLPVFAAGLLAGVAVVFEYPTALIGLVLAGYVLGVAAASRPRSRLRDGSGRRRPPADRVPVGRLRLALPHAVRRRRRRRRHVRPRRRRIRTARDSSAYDTEVLGRGQPARRRRSRPAGPLAPRPGGRRRARAALARGTTSRVADVSHDRAAFLVYNSGYTPVFGGIFGGGSPGPRLCSSPRSRS